MDHGRPAAAGAGAGRVLGTGEEDDGEAEGGGEVGEEGVGGDEDVAHPLRFPLAGETRRQDLDAYEFWPSPDWFDYDCVRDQAAEARAKGKGVVFVGDRLFEDIYGANQIGMRAVLIPHSVIPASQLGTDGTPDAVIDQLADLLPIIDSWLAEAERGTGD